MTHHNIAGSEAHRRTPCVQIRIQRRRRNSRRFVVAIHAAAAGVGIAAGLVDAFVFGQPIALGVIGLAFFVWSFWPDRNA